MTDTQDADEILKTLEALVVFYELWGFRLWKLPKISYTTDNLLDEDYDKVVNMGYAEKESYILEEVIAKMMAEGKSEEEVHSSLSITMIKGFLGDAWNQYRITQAGLDYWKSLDRESWLTKAVGGLSND